MIKNSLSKTTLLVLLFYVILLIPNALQAQLVVTQGASLPAGWTADSLVRNVLLGQGVEIYNVKFNGSTGPINCNAIGKFTTGANATGLGITEGIIMGSGAVSLAAGANNDGGLSATSGCTSQTCAPLIAAATGTVNDCAVLDFMFIPHSDSIRFRYVFASEEYPEYVCQNVNDIFGFFITGVDPRTPQEGGGGMYNNKNIALIHDSIPVTINTVNGGQSYGSNPCILTNTEFFVDNQTSNYIQYDGFTVVLTAEAKVVPCTPYHLIMAIGDVGDNVWDSGVFLEANSLSSTPLQFSFDNPANPQNPDNLYEGCEATLHIHRERTSSVPISITLDIEGEVVNGHDFEEFNQTFSFPADTQDMNVIIQPFMDGNDEGTNGIEYAKFVLSPSNGCPRSDSVEFYIIDTEPITLNVERDTIMNVTSQVQMRAVITGGMPNRTVRWRNMNTGSEITGEIVTVNTLPAARYLVIVEDSCHNLADDTITIGVRRNFAIQPHDTVVCVDEPLSLNVIGADSVVWSAVGHAPFETSSPSVTFKPQETSLYVTKSYITWNGQIWEDIDTFRIVTIPLPNMTLSASSERICEGQSTTLTASGTSQYSWDDGANFATANTHTFMPDSTTIYYVYGKTSGAECFGHDSILIIVDTIPDITIRGDAGICGGEAAELTVTTTAESFMWLANPNDATLTGQESHNVIVVNPEVTTEYTVNAINGVCTNSKSSSVAVEPPPVAIGEAIPKTVSLGQMEAVFVDRSQHTTTRKWELPDGTFKTDEQITYLVPDDVDSLNIRLWAYNPYLCFDTTTVTVYVDHTTLWVPNAFTPDESTNNTFLVKLNDVQRYHILIYDRMGQLVFESYDPEEPWTGLNKNGKECPQGAYTYLISCHKITYPFEQIIKKGTVVLLR